MKIFLITTLISVVVGFFSAKFLFSPKIIITKGSRPVRKNEVITEIIEKKSKGIVSKKFKKERLKIEIISIMLQSSPHSEQNPRNRYLASDQVEELIQVFPEDSFAAIKTLIEAGMIDEDPILKGDLLIQAAFLEGKQEEVRAMALAAIFEERVPKEIGLKDLQTEEEINKEYSDDPKILGIAQYYDAFLTTTIDDQNQIFDKTLVMIEDQPNIKVRRLLAKKYLETFPANGPAFWDLLKGKNIQLIPEGGKISIKGVTYQ